MSNLGKWIVEIALIGLLVGHLGLIPSCIGIEHHYLVFWTFITFVVY